jgi:hypothetical protein
VKRRIACLLSRDLALAMSSRGVISMQSPFQLWFASREKNRTLSSASNATGIAAHGNSLLLLLNILEELLRTLELPAVDRLCRLPGVLEGNAEVGAASAGRFGGMYLCRCVPDLFIRIVWVSICASLCRLFMCVLCRVLSKPRRRGRLTYGRATDHRHPSYNWNWVPSLTIVTESVDRTCLCGVGEAGR